jgi:hypothetical protein
MRSVLASLALVAGVAALATPAHADDRITIEHHNGCYTLWIEAKAFPLFCYNPPPI